MRVLRASTFVLFCIVCIVLYNTFIVLHNDARLATCDLHRLHCLGSDNFLEPGQRKYFRPYAQSSRLPRNSGVTLCGDDPHYVPNTCRPSVYWRYDVVSTQLGYGWNLFHHMVTERHRRGGYPGTLVSTEYLNWFGGVNVVASHILVGSQISGTVRLHHVAGEVAVSVVLVKGDAFQHDGRPVCEELVHFHAGSI